MRTRRAVWGLACLLAGGPWPSAARAQPAAPVQLATPHAHDDAVMPDGQPLRATPDELALRAILLRYAAGDVAGAVTALRTRPGRWTNEVVDLAVVRLEGDLKYHARPQNWLGATEFARVSRELRGDRLRLLQLTAALQVDASLAGSDTDEVGWRILAGEHAIDQLFRLRADVEREGPLAWPAVQAFVATWYRAAVARLQRMVEVTLGPALVARGLTRCPDDPDLLLAEGSYAETRVALARVDASLEATIWTTDDRRRWRDQLGLAAGAYVRASRAESANREVTIRLARVRLLGGDVRGARELLDSALASDLPEELRYLARLFRARAAEQAKDPASAARDYEAARQLRPDAPTPLLALSRLADEDHRRDEAQAWTDRALATAAGGADPWRTYIEGQAWRLDARMARLRRLEEP